MIKINRFFQWLPNWTLYLLGPIPGITFFILALRGKLGLDPLNRLEDQYGIWALQLLILGLCISPLCKIGLNLIKQRRAIGLLAFLYVCAHLIIWIAFDQGFDFARILKEIIKRPFITIGMLGFLLMIPLALTSNNRAIRKIGPKAWQNLHKLTYVVALLGAVHFLLVVKGWPPRPFVYISIICVLLIMRPIWLKRRLAK